MAQPGTPSVEVQRFEDHEWLESLDYVYKTEGAQRVRELFRKLQIRSQEYGIELHCPGTTPYLNTIPRDQQPAYPGSLEIERRLRNITRWNAMAMVVRANRELSGIGGHISTYASAATLFEVAFNHFLRAGSDGSPGDTVYYQGHASPGVYARAFLEGRLSEQDLRHFRRELNPQGGLASYPHPRLMPHFWELPTVSMGLSPIMAIYQARFNHYLQDRGLADTSRQKVWAFLGDGEMDEPESMGALTLASREHLSNLVFVVNCNLQRLDGPVRGNGHIIQELEAAFSGAGWRVIKVVWGGDWDPLLDKDTDGVLAARMEEVVDGQMQRYAAADGAYIRQDFFGGDPRLHKMVEGYSDEQIKRLRRGGHDPEKVYAAYRAAMEDSDLPTVILAQTIKGYGLGEAGEGRNVTHQQKKLNEQELREFRSRFAIPISDDKVAEAPFYRPAEDSEEMRYLKEKRQVLGGPLPKRAVQDQPIEMPEAETFDEYLQGSGNREVATTMAFVKLLNDLMSDGNVGKLIVPIVPDESRTFGMESLFRKYGIYSSAGQQYEPVDRQSLLYYNERKDGAILEEGITEAGSMSSFIPAGTSYATHGLPTIPFFIFYSMFGFQRAGDLVWAAADARARGFLIGGTSGRSTLSGEGLQHQDGQSHAYAYAVPSLKAYDPCFAYEIAVIVREGIRRMFVEQQDLMYYITVMNEFYPMPAMPEGAEEGILKGMYRFRQAANGEAPQVHLLGSGAILREAIKAQQMLETKYQVVADVWSVTSYKELYVDAVEAERYNRLHPDGERRRAYVQECFDGDAPFVAATDYLKVLPLSIAKYLPGEASVLGTDGFGRSDGREELRDFFEVDARHITLAALDQLAGQKRIDPSEVTKAINELEIDTQRTSALCAW
ncbi:MAG: pyruvate dehydrogenase (acetyl-transferring), homodimeric type [Chitinivibrionales bacterium]|nr:pyruvate dehydrogenase (acetyl-transferring), homodimeric type [Chitinivibrionales bacterium]